MMKKKKNNNLKIINNYLHDLKELNKRYFTTIKNFSKTKVEEKVNITRSYVAGIIDSVLITKIPYYNKLLITNKPLLTIRLPESEIELIKAIKEWIEEKTKKNLHISKIEIESKITNHFSKYIDLEIYDFYEIYFLLKIINPYLSGIEIQKANELINYINNYIKMKDNLEKKSIKEQIEFKNSYNLWLWIYKDIIKLNSLKTIKLTKKEIINRHNYTLKNEWLAGLIDTKGIFKIRIFSNNMNKNLFLRTTIINKNLLETKKQKLYITISYELTMTSKEIISSKAGVEEKVKNISNKILMDRIKQAFNTDYVKSSKKNMYIINIYNIEKLIEYLDKHELKTVSKKEKYLQIKEILRYKKDVMSNITRIKELLSKDQKRTKDLFKSKKL